MVCPVCTQEARRCDADCIYHHHFPTALDERYEAIVTAFGFEVIRKKLTELPLDQQDVAIASLYWDAAQWLRNPLEGPLVLHRRMATMVAELDQARHANVISTVYEVPTHDEDVPADIHAAADGIPGGLIAPIDANGQLVPYEMESDEDVNTAADKSPAGKERPKSTAAPISADGKEGLIASIAMNLTELDTDLDLMKVRFVQVQMMVHDLKDCLNSK